MSASAGITLYGDSILKATVPDEKLKYHFHFQQFADVFAGVQLNNRAKFGATVEKGLKLVQTDLQKQAVAPFALLEFGGNDCNYNWPAIAQAPLQQHLPATGLQQFTAGLSQMVQLLRAAGSTPVLMTLPPICGQRYFDFFSRGLDRGNLLAWLQNDVQVIYRKQELYSGAVARFAAANGLPCIDVRSRFLQQDSMDKLISADGIHLSDDGYALLFDALREGLMPLLQAG